MSADEWWEPCDDCGGTDPGTWFCGTCSGAGGWWEDEESARDVGRTGTAEHMVEAGRPMSPEDFVEQIIFPALNEADSIALVDPLGVTSPGAADGWLVELTDGSKLILTVEAT